MRRVAGLVGGIAALAVLLVGCGSAPPPSGAELWRAEIRNAISEATSDWERDILERSVEQGFISDGDFAYAEQMPDIRLSAAILPSAGVRWIPKE